MRDREAQGFHVRTRGAQEFVIGGYRLATNDNTQRDLAIQIKNISDQGRYGYVHTRIYSLISA
jgi:hypothetical protein